MMKNKSTVTRFLSVLLVAMLLVTTASFTVGNASAAGGLYLNQTSLTLGVGENYDLNSAYINRASVNNVRYKSSNTNIAQVRAGGGLVTAKRTGTVKITAYDTRTKASAVCVITVKEAPTNVYLNKYCLVLCNGEKFDLNSSFPSGQGAHSVIYTSSASSVASVKSAGGLVTAKKSGRAVITAKAYNGRKVTCEVIVNPIKIVDEKNRMILYADGSKSLQLSKGEKYQLRVNRDISHAFSLLQWTTSNRNIFTIDYSASGPIIKAGKCSGSTFLNVYTGDGKVDSCRIFVK